MIRLLLRSCLLMAIGFSWAFNAISQDQSSIPLSVGPVNLGANTDDRFWILWDFDAQTACNDNQLAGVEFAYWKFFVTGSHGSINPNRLYLMSWSYGVVIDTVDQPTTSTWGWRDLAFDGTYLYAGDEGDVIHAFNLNGELVPEHYIPKSQGLSVARGLTYDPVTDHFWVSDYNSGFIEIDRTGAVIWSGPFPTGWSNVYGLAWQSWGVQDPTLWAFCQQGTPQTTLRAYDPILHEPTGVSYQLPPLSGQTSQTAAGLAFTYDWANWPTLIGIAQGWSQDRLFIMTEAACIPPPVTITLAPALPLAVVPASGGTVNYTIMIQVVTQYLPSYDVWIMMGMPNGSLRGPVWGPINLTLPIGYTLTRARAQNIPARAPAGYYAYMAYIGTYPNPIISRAHLEFVKSEVGAGVEVTGWDCTGESLSIPDSQKAAPTLQD